MDEGLGTAHVVYLPKEDDVRISRESKLTVDTPLNIIAEQMCKDDFVQSERFYVVDMKYRSIDDPLFTSSLLLAFVYETMILNS